MADASLLVAALRNPSRLLVLSATEWGALIRIARAEALLGQLDGRASEAGVREALPNRVRTIFDDHAIAVESSQRTARWEARMAAAALAPLGCPIVLLKGAAYVAQSLPVAAGRTVGDLDILVPRSVIDAAEVLLKAAGWEALKQDPYDDAYYRRWMHELPPLAHADRGTMIDVHHTILPLTASRLPDAAAMIADAVDIGGGLAVLSPPDMLLHSVAHAFADGEFDGGLRNIWDIHRLLTDFAIVPGFWPALAARAALHDLREPLGRALRAAHNLFGAEADPDLTGTRDIVDALIQRRLLARDYWGYATRPLLRRAFWVRGHLLRMPLHLLVPHLWKKWRMSAQTT